MKKVIIFLAISLLLCGCGRESIEQDTIISTDAEIEPTVDEIETQEESESNITEIDYSCYYELIDTVKYGLQNGFTDDQMLHLDVTSCVFYTSTSYEILGYLITDLDGDGIDELIIGENGEGAWDSIIYDVFTIVDGEMLHTVMGWERNRYYLCENGVLANEGSGGAALSTYTYYNYSGQVIDSATEIGLIESVILDGDRDPDNPWFYSTTKSYDEQGEPISEERAQEIIDSYVYQKIKFTPFISEGERS